MRYASPTLHAIARIYGLLIKAGSNLQSLFLLYMRLTWGYQFLLTGLGKLHGIEKTAQFFASLHISHPYFNTYLVGWVEFLGGLCLILGFASRLAAIPLTIVLATALSIAHAQDISHFRFLFDPLTFVKQTPYPFLITCLMVFVFGPGRLSIDAWLKRWSEKRPKY
jgi:putative oxidoreductase